MTQVIGAASQRRDHLGRGECDLSGGLPDLAIGGRADDTVVGLPKQATIGCGPELAEVPAEQRDQFGRASNTQA